MMNAQQVDSTQSKSMSEQHTPRQLSAGIEYHVVNTLGWSSLRPLQEAAISPVLADRDCLLIAPTAGGKTEAAMFPVLSRMVDEEWSGFSVVYVAPLKALLNNLLPRLEQYAGWLGRRVALWHGDVGDAARRAILSDPPEILLTTPESLEAMLVSRRIDHRLLFRDLRAIVADEIHAFAGGDRGWHLVAVLERLQRIANSPIQRIGLSATLGNPEAVLRWFQGSNAKVRTSEVVSAGTPPSEPMVALDYVGSVENAATVIAALHAGEKRLVFCESRSSAEELAFALRQRRVTTFVSHSSLSLDQRRQSERAFAEAQNCVIVATSTLELGIDIGDLDRMIQLDSPRTVASFLQRLGRTGRRPGTTRNALFLATDSATLVRAAGLLSLWGRGFVEAIEPPAHPRHIAAQQLLALTLQEGRITRSAFKSWFSESPVMEDSDRILDYLIDEQFLAADGDWFFLGPRAEDEFGGRHFMELLSSFITGLDFAVREGTKEIGTVSALSLTSEVKQGTRPLLLGGRSWLVSDISWDRRVIHVAEDISKGKTRWASESLPESFEMVRARRGVLLGEDPPVELSQRARKALGAAREDWALLVNEERLVIERRKRDSVLWSFAGLRAHVTLAAVLPNESVVSTTNESMHFDPAFDFSMLEAVSVTGAVPRISPEAVEGLKFSQALPLGLAVATLGERFADRAGAAEVQRDKRVTVSHVGQRLD
ncbi:DEAD/DEAH box helicase [Microbacterium paraoxydans]|uniref:DEAD/DEAH box helicase n=1 Tax=Microbacterium paraoxydans TaxID=199592 RepID=UPI001964F026|nr:DEAD/DEAH box helicase [Microbacterium paraoxydans]QXE29466.1 DEAD/DEAH box helicase [Microbacterium paraoxydans]